MPAPFNFIVTWTWPLVGLAAALLSCSWMADSRAAETVLRSSFYALSSGVLASNLCAGYRFATAGAEEAVSFAVCDVVGVGVGTAVEGAIVRREFADGEWEYLRKVPERATAGVSHYVSEFRARVEGKAAM